jgi:hypothetical protein
MISSVPADSFVDGMMAAHLIHQMNQAESYQHSEPSRESHHESHDLGSSYDSGGYDSGGSDCGSCGGD